MMHRSHLHVGAWGDHMVLKYYGIHMTQHATGIDESMFEYSTCSNVNWWDENMKMYPWMKNVNWRKTGLKLGDGG